MLVHLLHDLALAFGFLLGLFGRARADEILVRTRLYRPGLRTDVVDRDDVFGGGVLLDQLLQIRPCPVGVTACQRRV
ncbi:MAG: hypothetical protein BRD23_02310 [Halobacteriales archaeon SW_9_67_25]|nr:MAG: hypothetical protein BRD23_02310 [Halobacteriales archaeon SW_9_67_25]